MLGVSENIEAKIITSKWFEEEQIDILTCAFKSLRKSLYTFPFPNNIDGDAH